jgi:hypothetical protein
MYFKPADDLVPHDLINFLPKNRALRKSSRNNHRLRRVEGCRLSASLTTTVLLMMVAATTLQSVQSETFA